MNLRGKATPAHRVCAVLLSLVLMLLPACDDGEVGEAANTTAEAISLFGKSEATGADFKMPSEVVAPVPEDWGGSTTIDTSGVQKGYVGVRARSESKLKFQVKCGEMTYNYDLPNDGTPTLYPINMGDGDYALRIMENIEGSSYAELDSSYLYVELESEFDPFLLPNIFCNYDSSSDCVKKAKDLMSSVSNEGEAVREICTFVADNVKYDYKKAEALAESTGYIPNPDDTLKEKKGICFDYASLSAAMLRSVGLPTKLMTGYVSPDDLYHAWIMVYVDGTWKTAKFSVSPNTWSRCDVTFASAGSGSFIGDGTTYTDRFTY